MAKQPSDTNTEDLPFMPSENLLNSSRQEMNNSLNLFHSHIKSCTSIVSALLFGVFAVLGFTLEKVNCNNFSSLFDSLLGTFTIFIGMVTFLLICCFCILSVEIIKGYYRVYCSNLYFTARLHRSFSQELCDSNFYMKSILSQESKAAELSIAFPGARYVYDENFALLDIIVRKSRNLIYKNPWLLLGTGNKKKNIKTSPLEILLELRIMNKKHSYIRYKYFLVITGVLSAVFSLGLGWMAAKHFL